MMRMGDVLWRVIAVDVDKEIVHAQKSIEI